MNNVPLGWVRFCKDEIEIATIGLVGSPRLQTSSRSHFQKHGSNDSDFAVDRSSAGNPRPQDRASAVDIKKEVSVDLQSRCPFEVSQHVLQIKHYAAP